MLPATLQFIIAMIACAISERMQRKLDYTQEEVRVLKEVVAAITGSGRMAFTADQRRRLAVAGKALSPEERWKYCQIVKPATVLAWFRQEDPSEQSELQSPRLAVREDDQIRVSQPVHLLRRATSAARGQGVHGPLHGRAFSPGPRWSTHRGPG